MNEICKTCRFWVEFVRQPRPDQLVGECRRHSPRVFQAADGRLVSKWPTQEIESWCGDHRSRPQPSETSVNAAQETQEAR